MKIVHVVLTGGIGSRLWPISRKSMPKQYIPMFGGKSLFQMTVERSKNYVDKIIVVGNKTNYNLSRSDLERAQISNYKEIIESEPRNTAAAISFAVLSVMPEDILIVTPSDHIIQNDDAYHSAIIEGIEFAKEGYLTTYGITPDNPETGYGYIEHNQNNVISFREKPDLATAQSFLDDGNFLWNSGIFCFQARTFLEEMSKYEPDILEKSKDCFLQISENFLPATQTALIPSKSIDYAIMEKSSKLKVVKSLFNWSDLGSFESIYKYWQVNGETEPFIGTNCVIGSKKHVEFLGLENVVLIETDDAILVLQKEMSQDVKNVYERINKNHPHLTL